MQFSSNIVADMDTEEGKATFIQNKKGGKDREPIESSTTPDPGYHKGKWKKYS